MCESDQSRETTPEPAAKVVVEGVDVPKVEAVVEPVNSLLKEPSTATDDDGSTSLEDTAGGLIEPEETKPKETMPEKAKPEVAMPEEAQPKVTKPEEAQPEPLMPPLM